MEFYFHQFVALLLRKLPVIFVRLTLVLTISFSSKHSTSPTENYQPVLLGYRNLRKILFMKDKSTPNLFSIAKSIVISSWSKLLVNKIAKPYMP